MTEISPHLNGAVVRATDQQGLGEEVQTPHPPLMSPKGLEQFPSLHVPQLDQLVLTPTGQDLPIKDDLLDPINTNYLNIIIN